MDNTPASIERRGNRRRIPPDPTAASWSVSAWCELARAAGVRMSRQHFYELPSEGRPHIVYAGNVPLVLESVADWLARMGRRWSVAAWCRECGVSRGAFYTLAPEEQPHRNAQGWIEESPRTWLHRMDRRQGGV